MLVQRAAFDQRVELLFERVTACPGQLDEGCRLEHNTDLRTVLVESRKPIMTPIYTQSGVTWMWRE